MSQKRRKKRNKYYEKIAMICFLGVILCLIFIVGRRFELGKNNKEVPRKESKKNTYDDIKKKQREKEKNNREDDSPIIYSFLQGPKSWKKRKAWSGYWGDLYIDRGYFGGFGCGLCCMANVYSTVSPYECSPIDMYRFVKKKTGYSGGGAIAWGYIRRGAEKAGLNVTIKQKPKEYDVFKKMTNNSKAVIILVSSRSRKSYWKNTSGHYVTIYPVSGQEDKVFLADSGDPHHNRKIVSLKKMYWSLKEESNFQLLTINGYNKEKDQFRHKKVSGKWVDGRKSKSRQK